MSEVPPAASPPLTPLSNLAPFIVPPNMRALLAALKGEIFAEINCHQIGVIQTFDSDLQTAQVKIVFQRLVYNNPPDGTVVQPEPTIVQYPLLVDVPCVVMGGLDGSLQLPVVPGDECLLFFCDRDFDQWFVNGAYPAPPNSLRMHSLSDAFALVGVRSAEQAIPDFDNTRVRLVKGTTQVALGDKVRIKNSATNLKAVMDQLCDVLTNWVNTGGSTPNGATVTAIAALKTLSDSLLES